MLALTRDDDDDIYPLSLMEAEQISSFISQCEKFRALILELPTDQAESVETRQIFNRESGEVFSRSRMWLEDRT